MQTHGARQKGYGSRTQRNTNTVAGITDGADREELLALKQAMRIAKGAG